MAFVAATDAVTGSHEKLTTENFYSSVRYIMDMFSCRRHRHRHAVNI